MIDVKLYNDDCFNVLPQIPCKSVDLICCDLPYGTTKCKWDVLLPFEKLWEQYNRIIKDEGAIVLFAKEPFTSLVITSNLNMFKYRWNWQKDTKSNFMQCNYQPLNNIEDICVFSKAYAREIKDKCKMKYFPQFTEGGTYSIPKDSKGTSLFNDNNKKTVYCHKQRDTSKRFPFITLRFNTDKEHLHPTQKPVALLEYLINTYTRENDLVLDNCMGSGTCGVACKKLNRNFIGIEKEKNYFDIARKRIDSTIRHTNDIATSQNNNLF